MISPMYDHIYFSPHLDDVVLSCGGMIHSQIAAGERVLVVTFFAASPPDYSITPFTQELRQRWGNVADSVAMRRAEDERSLGLLGAERAHLPFLDCVYRLDPSTHLACYPTVEHIFAEVHPAESSFHHHLLATCLQQVGALPTAIVYAPLTAGHHVDHILVQRAALLLLQRGQQVLFYEDYPYAGNEGVVRQALAPWPGHCWERETVAFGEDALAAKGQAVACYASQISTFWRDAEEMRQALRAQALAVGRERYGENLWHLAPLCASPTGGA